MTTTHTDTLASNIEGSHGTIVFGNGVPALTGHIQDIGEDYVTVETDRDTNSHLYRTTTCLVPIAAIAYFRFSHDA